MLLSFPTDVSLYVLSFLSVHDLRSLLLVSRSARALIRDNEQTVYHQAAVLHRFAPPETPLEDVKQAESLRGGWLDDVQSWKELCMFFVTLVYTLKQTTFRLARQTLDHLGAELGWTWLSVRGRLYVQ